jgi:hypothetical protein
MTHPAGPNSYARPGKTNPRLERSGLRGETQVDGRRDESAPIMLCDQFGCSTVSMTWMTPFDCITSAMVMRAARPSGS